MICRAGTKGRTEHCRRGSQSYSDLPSPGVRGTVISFNRTISRASAFELSSQHWTARGLRLHRTFFTATCLGRLGDPCQFSHQAKQAGCEVACYEHFTRRPAIDSTGTIGWGHIRVHQLLASSSIGHWSTASRSDPATKNVAGHAYQFDPIIVAGTLLSMIRPLPGRSPSFTWIALEADCSYGQSRPAADVPVLRHGRRCLWVER